MSSTHQPSLRERIHALLSGRRRTAVMTAVHIAVIWILVACALAGDRLLVVAAAVFLTALAIIASRRNWQLVGQAREAERAETERRFLAAVIDASPALGAVIDGQGKVIQSNPRFRDALGCSEKPDAALFQLSLKGVDRLLAFAAGEQPGTVEFDLELQRGHDTRRLRFAASRQTLPVSGQCVVLIGQDETERYRIQQSVTQAAKLATLGELSSGIAHELSQPLNVIRMAAQNVLLAATPEDGGSAAGEEASLDIAPLSDTEFRPFVVGKLERIVNQVDRAASILSRMRIFRRPSESGPAEFDVREACDQALALVASPFRRAGIEVIREFGSEPVRIVGHEALLQQVIVNLLVNARDALVNGPAQPRRVTLAVLRPEDGGISVQVRDSGPGIPAGIRDRIFEPFFTTKPVGANPGLGLSLSYGVVHDAGGELRLLPDGPGAAFEILLPASHSPARSAGVARA